MQGKQKIMRADELQVTGLHNVANALAALALCRALDMPLAPLVDALRAFKGLPHRVEKVAEVNGITYYDDSKGTNVGATEAALKGLGKPAVVILGGDGKGQDFSPLKEAVARHARAVVLIGRDAPLIEQAIAGCGKPVLKARDMDEAVRICHRECADRRCGADVARLRQLRYVQELSASRGSVHRGGEETETEAACSAQH